MPAPTTADVADALVPMIRELVGLGVVAVHDPRGLSERRDLDGPLAAYRGLAAAGTLVMRVHACVRPEQLEAAGTAGLRSGSPLGPDPLDRLRLGWLKTFADGSLGLPDGGAPAAPGDAPRRAPAAQRGLRAGAWLAPP